MRFLSTPSARRATATRRNLPILGAFLSTPSARRATVFPAIIDIVKSISIHALREEGDFAVRDLHLANIQFLSTPSARRATLRRDAHLQRHREFLSTPSARRATSSSTSDRAAARSFLSTPSARRATISQPRARMEGCNFYPRPPRGGRPFPNLAPVWRVAISIHALREEGDAVCTCCKPRYQRFLSTPSARMVTLYYIA